MFCVILSLCSLHTSNLFSLSLVLAVAPLIVFLSCIVLTLNVFLILWESLITYNLQAIQNKRIHYVYLKCSYFLFLQKRRISWPNTSTSLNLCLPKIRVEDDQVLNSTDLNRSSRRYITLSEAYLEPRPTSTMELFCKNDEWLLSVDFSHKNAPW